MRSGRSYSLIWKGGKRPRDLDAHPDVRLICQYSKIRVLVSDSGPTSVLFSVPSVVTVAEWGLLVLFCFLIVCVCVYACVHTLCLCVSVYVRPTPKEPGDALELVLGICELTTRSARNQTHDFCKSSTNSSPARHFSNPCSLVS